MPASETVRRARRRSARAGLLAALAVAAGTATAACGTAADAGRSNSDEAFLTELASRLTSAGDATYTATYTIGGGVTGTIAQAQKPNRVAFTYPTGITMVTPQGATQCDRGAEQITCLQAPSAAVMSSAIEHGGMIRPDAVISMLSGVAMDPDAIVSESDTSYAGLPSTCVSVTYTSGTEGFDACVTSTGLLASFNGTVGAAHIDMALNRVDATVADDAFRLPAGAKITGASPSR